MILLRDSLHSTRTIVACSMASAGFAACMGGMFYFSTLLTSNKPSNTASPEIILQVCLFVHCHHLDHFHSVGC